MVGNIHRPHFHGVLETVNDERLNRDNRDVRAHVENQNFVQDFAAKLAAHFPERNEKVHKLVAKRPHEGVILRVVLRGAVREADFHVVRARKPVSALPRLPRTRIDIHFRVRLSDFPCEAD